jgi:hypothetical protein
MGWGPNTRMFPETNRFPRNVFGDIQPPAAYNTGFMREWRLAKDVV